MASTEEAVTGLPCDTRGSAACAPAADGTTSGTTSGNAIAATIVKILAAALRLTNDSDSPAWLGRLINLRRSLG
ncbi:hypothetical protein GCM10020220_039020 [Nonomuraea rubra]